MNIVEKKIKNKISTSNKNDTLIKEVPKSDFK